MPWIEFKENNADPKDIGKYISALSNAARLADRHFAYVLWAIRDRDHAVVGTSFDPAAAKEQQQPLEFWLAQRRQPDLSFVFRTVQHREGRLVLLEIPAATTSPVEFDKVAYLRIGSATPRLSDYPDHLRSLWDRLRPYVWESGIAAQFVTSDEVLTKLDYPSYFDLIGQPLPSNHQGILARLAEERLVAEDVGVNGTSRIWERFCSRSGSMPSINALPERACALWPTTAVAARTR